MPKDTSDSDEEFSEASRVREREREPTRGILASHLQASPPLALTQLATRTYTLAQEMPVCDPNKSGESRLERGYTAEKK